MVKICTHTLNKHVYIEYLVYRYISISHGELTMRWVKTYETEHLKVRC